MTYEWKGKGKRRFLGRDYLIEEHHQITFTMKPFFMGSYVLRLLLLTTPTQHFGKWGRKSNGLCILFHEIVVSFSLRVNLMSWEYKRERDDDCFETVAVGRIVYRCILNTHVLYP